jgi:signal transduction histidine kinase
VEYPSSCMVPPRALPGCLNAHGQLLGMMETRVEIDEHWRAEEALSLTRDIHLTHAEQIGHTGAFGWNPASGEVFWSQESFRIFGYEPTVKPTLDLVLERAHPDDAAPAREAIERARNDRQSFDLEYRLLLTDQSIKHIHIVARSVTDEQGQVIFMGAVMDVTARKLVEDELRGSERRYRHLFEYMPIALLQLNPHALTELFKSLREQGVSDLGPYLDRNPDLLYRMMDLIVVEDVNDYAIRLFGAHDRGQLLGPSQSFWKKNPYTFRRAMESRFRGESSFQQEIELVTLDGRNIKVLFSAARLAGGTGLSLVGLIDITDRARAQEQLQQLQAEFAHAARLSMLGELAASIAHEVNQPLTALMINGETMLRWLDRPEPNRAQVRAKMVRMNADAARAGAVIGRIREMAAGRAPQRTPLALHDVITESLLFLRHELQSKGVSVSFDLPPALPKVIGDRTQLQQVVVNLAMNAAQAMTEAQTTLPRLSIKTMASDGQTLTCVIEDSGPGIEPGHMPRLFDSFFTTKEAGMGMGLAISRSIIEAHRGEIRADNGSVLGGARFTFVLPLDTSSA